MLLPIPVKIRDNDAAVLPLPFFQTGENPAVYLPQRRHPRRNAGLRSLIGAVQHIPVQFLQNQDAVRLQQIPNAIQSHPDPLLRIRFLYRSRH